MFVLQKLQISPQNIQIVLPLSDGAVECNDHNPAEGQDPPHTHTPTNVLDKVLNNLMMRKFGECGVPFHWHHSQVHSEPKWQHQVGLFLLVKKLFDI